MTKRIYVEWWDHCSSIGWISPENCSSPMLMKSFGYLVKEEKTHIVISSTITQDGDYCDPLTIMKNCIEKRKKVK